MAQFDGSEHESAVSEKLASELTVDAHVLLAKLKGLAYLFPSAGTRFFTDVIEPMVADMRRITSPGADSAKAAGDASAASEDAATIHPFEPRRGAQSTTPANYTQVPTSEIQACIVQALEDSGDPMRIADLQTVLEDQSHAVTASNLSVILHRMVHNGLIHRPHRGVYAALPSDKVRRIRGE